AELGARQVEGQPVHDAVDRSGRAATFLRQPFDAVAIDSDERELRGYEEPRRHDEEQDGEQTERGTDECRLLRATRRTEPLVTATKTRVAVNAGALTMVALCFANGLQQGIDQSQSQAIESLKTSFAVTDFQIGLIRVATGAAGALGALLIARLCRDRARTKVLAGMFTVW